MRSAAVAKSSLMTSEGQDPTRNNCLMSGRRSSNSLTTRSISCCASAMPARSVSSRMAVAKRGSAKIITPAADCKRCAQVRLPTTRKKASCILRCNQMMPVKPQNTSCWPRCFRTGVLEHPRDGGGANCSVMLAPPQPEERSQLVTGQHAASTGTDPR